MTPLEETTRPSLRVTLLYAVALSALVVCYRVLPRYLIDPSENLVWNLAPMGALSLFIGSRLRGAWAVLFPLLAMLVADLLLMGPLARLGYRSLSLGSLVIYGCYVLYLLAGRLIPARSLSPVRIMGASLIGSLQFFLITNFLCWPGSSLYSQDIAGLFDCYVKALPFFRSTLYSDLMFPLVFFAGHALVMRAFAPQAKEQAT